MASRARLLGLVLVVAAMVGGPAIHPALAAPSPIADVRGGTTAERSSGAADTLLQAPQRAVAVRADDDAWAERRVDRVILRYAPQTADEVDWYAEAATAAHAQVTDVFGVERHDLTLTLFPDEESYARVNPLAARSESILGHARPTANEIGLALNRLRDQTDALRRDTIRHELTHIVLGELSDQRLPIGLQEGIAQYLEQDPEGRERVVRGLRRGIDEDQLLPLSELNRQRPFLSRAWFAYPQSYSFVAFLAERYGLGRVVELVKATRDAETLDIATRRAFDRSIADLETEWQAFLPGFVDGGYRRNVLDIWEMTEPRRHFAESRYAEAGAGFEQAARLFEGLGRVARLEQARDGSRRSALGVEAIELSHRGAAALGGFEYERAADLLGQAEARWAGVGDDERRAATTRALGQAREGVAAQGELAEARTLLDGWTFQDATDRALDAGRVFAALGDEARTEEANVLVADVRDTKNRLAAIVIGAGVSGLGVAGAGWLLGRRSRRRQTPQAQIALRSGGPGGAREWSL